MALTAHLKWVPSGVFLATLVLVAYHRFASRQLAASVAAREKEATVLWDQLVQTNRHGRACAGLTLENYTSRLATFQQAVTNLHAAEELVRRRVAIPEAVRHRMTQAWQLSDFQTEAYLEGEQLVRLGKEQGVTLEPAVLAGLPIYSIRLPEPRLLWPRLQMAGQLLLTAIHCKVGTVRTLNQLPSVTHPAVGPGSPALEELPMRIDLVGSTEAVGRFLRCLPLRGDELKAVGLAGPLTNKTAFFIDRVLVRKLLPERPGDVQAEVRVCGYSAWPGTGSGPATP
jgi:hypothetical protein